MPVIGVEEKFSLMNRDRTDLEDRLRQLGFSMFKKVNMVDWYFDNWNYDLLRRDCWLRCRDTGTSSQWQLKCGQTSHARTAVYEEIDGVQAAEFACSLLTRPKLDQFHGYIIPTHNRPSEPVLPISDSGLTSFAKIDTHRSSWKVAAGKFRALTVDLDATNFEYAVGEVEAIVEDAEHIDSARELVQELIQEIGGESDKAAGKLEYYLQMNRPEVYKICIDCNVL